MNKGTMDKGEKGDKGKLGGRKGDDWESGRHRYTR
jgi:hypothetical protein